MRGGGGGGGGSMLISADIFGDMADIPDIIIYFYFFFFLVNTRCWGPASLCSRQKPTHPGL